MDANIQREAIRDFIRENLTVSIDVSESMAFMSGNSMKATVRLMLEGEEIDYDSCTFDVSNNS